MSFTRMHNDHLDPHLEQAEDYGFEAIKAALQAMSSNRWDWDRIDCCYTGKDADLETCGQQGIELISVSEDGAKFILHCGKTVAGLDVCLNVSSKLTDEQHEAKREAYLEAAQEVVCSFPFPGEWSGDDWFLSGEVEGDVPLVLTADESETDAEATARAIIAAAFEGDAPLCADWDREANSMERCLDYAAGWRDSLGRRRRALS